MMRLLVLAALVSVVCYMLFGRWPWQFLASRPTRSQAFFRARQLLELGADAGEAEIRAAHRRKVAALHPDRGGSTKLAQDLNAARDLLLAELKFQPTEPPE